MCPRTTQVKHAGARAHPEAVKWHKQIWSSVNFIVFGVYMTCILGKVLLPLPHSTDTLPPCVHLHLLPTSLSSRLDPLPPALVLKWPFATYATLAPHQHHPLRPHLPFLYGRRHACSPPSLDPHTLIVEADRPCWRPTSASCAMNCFLSRDTRISSRR
jgi:hypothetical protein